MTQPIDRAFVDIEARTQDFSRDLNRDVEKAYDKVDRQTEVLSRKISTSFDEAGREVKRTFTSISKDGVVTTRVVEEAFDEAGDAIARAFKFATKDAVAGEELIAEVARIAADTTADAWERAGERIEDAFREAERVAATQMALMAAEAEAAERKLNDRFFKRVENGFDRVGAFIVKIGTAFSDFVGNVITSGGFIKFLAILGAIVALTGPIIALGGALADLIGFVAVIPAGLGVLLAAITPLIFAFQGLGDAIKAVNDGDPEKIAEAMKKLSPAARSVVREITGLNKVFDTFRKTVQQGFFAPLVGDIGHTVRTLLPQLQGAIAKVAEAFGRAASNFLEFVREPAQVKILNNLFTATASILDKVLVGFENFGETFFRLIDAGLPFIQRFADAFGNVLTEFSKFTDASIKSGAFNEFVEDAISTTKELFELIGALGRLLGALFGNADDEGRDFIQTLTDMVNKMSDFFESAEGQRTIQDLIDSIHGTVFALGLLGKGIVFTIGFLHDMMDFWKFVGDQIGKGAKAIGKFFSDLWADVIDGFNTVKTFIDGVVDAIGDFVSGLVSSIGKFFAELPGRVLAAIQALPGLVIGFFQRMIDNLLRIIGIGIGLVIFTFTKLPGMIIDVVQKIPGAVAAFFTQLWGNIVDITKDGIALLTSFVTQLPGIIGKFFSDAWNKAKQLTTDGVNAVINFVKSLPGRISALATSIGNAIAGFFSRIFSGGKAQASSAIDAIIGFVRKLPGRLTSFVSDVGGQIGQVIKNVLNRAIDKINQGLADVDRFVPGDLPRIPRLAEGAIVKKRPGGILAQIGEGNSDEAVIPIDKLLKAIEGDRGTNITFGPGSVAVTFEGVIPTEADARRTGNAVGLGIADALEKRNIRVMVRAL